MISLIMVPRNELVVENRRIAILARNIIGRAKPQEISNAQKKVVERIRNLDSRSYTEEIVHFDSDQLTSFGGDL